MLLRSIISPRLISRFSTSRYPFLKELGLAEVNHGAYYNGKWQSTNSTGVFKSINPADETLIASTHTASIKDYDNALGLMVDAQK